MGTHADPVLSQLKNQIFQGWPDVRRSVLEIIYPFWNYGDEPSSKWWVDIQGSQVNVPSIPETWIPQGFIYWPFGRGKDLTQNQRMHMLARYKRGHQGIHQGMQHNLVYKTQPTKAALSSHMMYWVVLTGSRLFQQLPTDQSFNKPMAAHVINILKMMFSEHGIPACVLRDQGR